MVVWEFMEEDLGSTVFESYFLGLFLCREFEFSHRGGQNEYYKHLRRTVTNNLCPDKTNSTNQVFKLRSKQLSILICNCSLRKSFEVCRTEGWKMEI